MTWARVVALRHRKHSSNSFASYYLIFSELLLVPPAYLARDASKYYFPHTHHLY